MGRRSKVQRTAIRLGSRLAWRTLSAWSVSSLDIATELNCCALPFRAPFSAESGVFPLWNSHDGCRRRGRDRVAMDGE